jgi:hypothetical protein
VEQSVGEKSDTRCVIQSLTFTEAVYGVTEGNVLRDVLRFNSTVQQRPGFHNGQTHQALILRPSCGPAKVGVNRKSLKSKIIFP